MSGPVLNCKKCNQIFQKSASDWCPQCIQAEDGYFTVLYRVLQKSASQGGIAIDALAAEVEVSVEDIEKLYREGRLSTAAIYLKIPCQACSVLTAEHERRGRYCLRCSDVTSTQAGVEVKTLQALEKEAAEEKRRTEQRELLQKSQIREKEKPARKFGAAHRHR